uniref:Uncharacterized protein n=1 Tax=Lactuca sativa TaxID=4236 RepID=A0A9R1UJT6_LACSA|nr:hypothetical protein LSAT_V11C900483220 [Lactuca sativa]
MLMYIIINTFLAVLLGVAIFEILSMTTLRICGIGYVIDFIYDDLEDTWNKINRYFSLPERRETFKCSISGLRCYLGCYCYIWVYEILPSVRACGFVLRKNRDTPRMK